MIIKNYLHSAPLVDNLIVDKPQCKYGQGENDMNKDCPVLFDLGFRFIYICQYECITPAKRVGNDREQY